MVILILTDLKNFVIVDLKKQPPVESFFARHCLEGTIMKSDERSECSYVGLRGFRFFFKKKL